jgi:predicted transposase/invertase (TIGR01784 family)
MMDAGQIQRFYLDEMEEPANAPLGMSILYLIRQTESQAPVTARELITRIRSEIGDESLRVVLIQLIETVIIYKLSHLSREEIQTMLQVHDIRQSRVYQEALQEGIEKGIAIANEIARLAVKNKSAEEIAKDLKLDVELVRSAMVNVAQN